MDHIALTIATDQKWGIRIMKLHVALYCLHIIVGVAVSAEMSTAVISADIAGEVTCALFPGRLLVRHYKPLSDGLLVGLNRHASPTVSAVLRKKLTLSARLYHKAGNVDKCVRECKDIILWFGDGPIVDKARSLLEIYEGKQEIPARKPIASPEPEEDEDEGA